MGPNLDFEENSPHQEGIITEVYESPDKSYLEQPQELTDLVDSTNLIHKYLPKQVDIDKIMNITKKESAKRYPLATYHQGDTSRLFKQFIFQRSIQIYGPE